jgi:hypothetical protein
MTLAPFLEMESAHRPLLDGIEAQRSLCLWRVVISFTDEHSSNTAGANPSDR